MLFQKVAEEELNDIFVKEELLILGYAIQSATLDGKRGLYKAFNNIPIQK